jgi:ABC-type nitrate/sulfonate/bicarbonate transport system ATPase subunit
MPMHTLRHGGAEPAIETAGLSKAFGRRRPVHALRPTTLAVARRAVGYLPEGHRFPPFLTAHETLTLFAHMNGVDPAERATRAERLLETVRLMAAADRKAGTFSKGMSKRIAAIHCAIKSSGYVTTAGARISTSSSTSRTTLVRRPSIDQPGSDC